MPRSRPCRRPARCSSGSATCRRDPASSWRSASASTTARGGRGGDRCHRRPTPPLPPAGCATGAPAGLAAPRAREGEPPPAAKGARSALAILYKTRVVDGGDVADSSEAGEGEAKTLRYNAAQIRFDADRMAGLIDKRDQLLALADVTSKLTHAATGAA